MTAAATPRPWRCFVAVPLPDELRDRLRVWVDAVRAARELDADWRWTDPASWHLTIAFLGATPPDSIPGILDGLAGAATVGAPFEIEAGGLGRFPGRRKARVLWFGIRDRQRRLQQLADAVRAATGTDESSPFRPHVTLARARDRTGADLPRLPVESLPTAVVPVRSLHLMRSHLARGPAHYETLAEVGLGIQIAVGANA